MTDEERMERMYENVERDHLYRLASDLTGYAHILPITTVRRILAVLKEANEEGKESK